MSGTDSLIAVGWAYQDERWIDAGRWHLCQSEPRTIEGRNVQRVYLADTIATLTAELDRVKLHLSAWEDSARINKARADEATAEMDALRDALAPFANLDMPADDKWTCGTFLIEHADIRRARALQGSSSADEGRGT